MGKTYLNGKICFESNAPLAAPSKADQEKLDSLSPEELRKIGQEHLAEVEKYRQSGEVSDLTIEQIYQKALKRYEAEKIKQKHAL